MTELAGKKEKTGMERSGPTPLLSAGPAGGRPYGSSTGGAPAATPLAANAFYATRRRLRAWPGGGGGGARSWTGSLLSTPLAADFGPGLDGAVEGCAALAWSLPFYLSLTGLSTGGQAMLGHWSQHHPRL